MDVMLPKSFSVLLWGVHVLLVLYLWRHGDS